MSLGGTAASGTIRHIYQYAQADEATVLRRPAEPVDRVTRSLGELIDDMLATMYDAEGVGLAAPQVGVSRRVIVVDVGEGPVALINPRVTRTGEGREAAFEGCLSVPDRMGEVERPDQVQVAGLDRRGRKVWVEAEGWFARALQHELDHLDGVLFLDRARRVVEIPPEKRLRVVFMGTPDFAVPLLDNLLDEGFRVRAVVTNPDRPRGRGQQVRPSPVARAAAERGLELLQPEQARDPAFVEQLRARKPDVLLTCAYGQILSREVLDLPRVACLNVHASLLPRYRGAAPIQRALLDGVAETGMTIFYMNERLDAGDILLQRALPVTPEDTAGTLHQRLSRMAAEMVPEALRLLVSDDPPRRAQDEAAATSAPRLRRGEERVRWDRDAAAVANQIRAFDPRPGAVTHWRDRPLKLFAARASGETPGGAGAAAPGTVLAADAARGLVVATAAGAVRVGEVQPGAGRRMPVADFLNGHDLAPGERLR